MRLFPLLMLLCGCAGQSSATRDPALITSLEERVGELEKRLAKVEESTEPLPAIMEGLQQLLDQFSGQGGRRRGPDPSAVYAVPIEGSPFIGPKHAKVTMVKAFDYYCGYCNSVRPVLAQLSKEYGKDLKIVFKDFVIHEETARLPALASCAAHRQGKFFPAFSEIWKRGLEARNELDEKQLLDIAKTLKLSLPKFKKDMQGDCIPEVRRNQAQLAAVGTTGTPAFYINGRFLGGARPIEQFRTLIDEELYKANQKIKAGAKLGELYESILKSGKRSL